MLKEAGDSAIVASICPKVLDKSAEDYGYNPAVEALIDRVTGIVDRRCLPRSLPLDEQGRVPCEVVQAFPKLSGGCDCASLGLADVVDPTLADAVQDELVSLGQCGRADPKCAGVCRCQLPQFEGEDLLECQNSFDFVNGAGFCYISATPGEPFVGNVAFVEDCRAEQRRDLRLLGGAPKSQLFTLLACPTGN